MEEERLPTKVRSAYTRPVSLDTTMEAREAYIEAVRRQTPAMRFLRAIEMSEDARQIAIEGERRRHPGMSTTAARAAVCQRILGATFPQSHAR